MKKKSRKKRYVVLAFFFVLFFGGGIALYVYAQNNSSTKATNTVEVGKVKVNLEMTKHDAGVISASAVNVVSVTEGAISNAVTVENIGDYSAYIRMYVKKYWKITEGGTELTQEQIAAKYQGLSTDAIEIYLKEGWKEGTSSSKYPGYKCYYYKDAVPGSRNRGMNIVHFSDYYHLKTEQTTGDGGITNDLLLKFTKNGAKVDGFYEVFVEAIQADTCIPITSAEGGDTVITGWNDTTDPYATMPPVSFDPAATPVGVVNFRSENTDITNADSFITMNNLVPGSTEERVVEIKNTSNQKLPVYIYAESAESYDSLTDVQKKWLEQLQLVVEKKDGTILYQDSLYKPNSDIPMLSKDNPIKIDEFPAGTSQNLYVAIYCPATWTEGDVDVKVNWIFSSSNAVPIDTQRPSGGGGAPIITTTDVPIVTEEPVMETDVPETTKIPEKTDTPKDTPSATDVLKVTDAPVVTQAPSEKPKETNAIVTEHPNWEEEETVVPATEQPKPESTVVVTKEPTSEPNSTGEIKPLGSGDPDDVEPVETLEADSTLDEMPKRTSTPKEPTKVEEVYPTKTGDVTPIVLWMVLFWGSCIGMISAFTAWRKRR